MFTEETSDTRIIKVVCKLSEELQAKIFVETGRVNLTTEFALSPFEMTRHERAILIEWYKKMYPSRLGALLFAISQNVPHTITLNYSRSRTPEYFSDVLDYMESQLQK